MKHFQWLKVAYYTFRMKTVDFFKLKQGTKASSELLITTIDVNYP